MQSLLEQVFTWFSDDEYRELAIKNKWNYRLHKNSNRSLYEHIFRWFSFDEFSELASKNDWDITLYRKAILEPLNLSTITMGGDFDGIDKVHEKDHIDLFANPTGAVKFVGSNYGEHKQKEYIFKDKKEKTTNRGRKPKDKKPKKRAVGSGKYFNSQITFKVAPNDHIKRPSDKLLYYFKLFRTGNFQVPGVIYLDMIDIEKPLKDLTEFLSERLKRQISIRCTYIQMINCKTSLSEKDTSVNIDKLGELILKKQEQKDPIKIQSVRHKTTLHTRITVKFDRAIPKNKDKATTLKILKQKINIEGATSYEDVNNIYNWLCKLILLNYNSVIYNKNKKVESDSSDTDYLSSTTSGSDSDDEDEIDKGNQNDYAINPYGFD
jgi:hypothetical protein